MKSGEMIRLTNYQIFMVHMSTLKKTSVDDAVSPSVYMTESMHPAIDFDAVKNDYVKTLHLSYVPGSNDAVFQNDHGGLVFVEFKNGVIDSSTKYQVRKKIYDSVLIFCDIVSKNIADLRGSVEYILVYNEYKNIDNTELSKDIEEIKRKVSSSRSLNKIAISVSSFAKKEYIRFGIHMFENYCFQMVHTYTEKEFEEYLKENYCQ